MIPKAIQPLTVLEEIEYPSTTYKIDLVHDKITKLIYEHEAVMQAVKKILSTERYSCVIYNSDYGIELQSLIGKDFDYVTSELPRRITEALQVDDRILGISEFTTTKNLDCANVTFKVTTIYGDIIAQTEVPV